MGEFKDLDRRIDDEECAIERDSALRLLEAFGLDPEPADSYFQAGYPMEFIRENVEYAIHEPIEDMIDEGVADPLVLESCRLYAFATGKPDSFSGYPPFNKIREPSMPDVLVHLQQPSFEERCEFRYFLNLLPCRLRDLAALRRLSGAFEPYQLKVIDEDCSSYVRNAIRKINDPNANLILASHSVDYMDV